MNRRGDTKEESDFRAEARAWLEKHAPDWRREAEALGFGKRHTEEAERAWFEHGRLWQRMLYEGGWAALTLPTEIGGRALSPGYKIVFEEEAGRYGANSGFIGASLSMFMPALLAYGTREQKERHVHRTLCGDDAWCQLFSEPGAGSDLAALRFAAVQEGDELVLNGQKVWTSSAQHCEWGFLLARTNLDKPKHEGITFLLVDMRSPGVEARPLVTIAGGRHFNEVFFTDVRVPMGNVVGEIDAGWTVARLVLMNESFTIGTGGPRDDGAEALLTLAREQGRLDDPSVREQLASSYAEERILGWLGERIRNAVLDGRRPDVDGSVVKILSSESRSRRSEIAASILDQNAVLAGEDAPAGGRWQNLLLERFTSLIGGGTVDVHRNGIGERVLGLPREARPDRHLPFRELGRRGKKD